LKSSRGLGVILNEAVFQAERRISAQTLFFRRSLAPLVKTRGVGMTPLRRAGLALNFIGSATKEGCPSFASFAKLGTTDLYGSSSQAPAIIGTNAHPSKTAKGGAASVNYGSGKA